ncbi:sugar phosphate isomerase/epimerase [Frankia sp. AgB1.9]|uniref:sugar phosphate isomerase/epimerase family protein n=1 Tax=unclassified Frankia TaxID=2632575 RepID=UPI00193277C6|nr:MULTISPECIES: sugar phosphate isomerase/epimerase [unclassified Frankia]MBL7487815.1 sugar phosphate isomerase/epimerase [Frankia sp. AgW1.1]MBL7547352.1 sugar phosphate isomerase/epimerase [Frankia sp. AgB1.9]MBL7624553.1 sugar phosphate isomerase/epimerase [Frankia sp. AgB1.8]
MAEALGDIDWVLWSGTVGLQSPLEGRIDAATAGGFGQLSLSPLDVVLAQEAGISPVELGRRLRDAGLEIVLDGLANWYDGEPFTVARSVAFTADEVLELCEALRPVSLTVFSRPTCDLPVEEVAASFGTLCDRAAEFGVRVQLEFMPIMAIGDLPSAAAIVQAADRANGGLVLDTWHFFRGNPDFGALEALPGDRIFTVQVADGAAEIQGSLAQDTFHRLLPGDGCFDLGRLLGTLDQLGALRSIGPEVISPVTAAMPPAEAALLARDRVRELVRKARS